MQNTLHECTRYEDIIKNVNTLTQAFPYQGKPNPNLRRIMQLAHCFTQHKLWPCSRCSNSEFFSLPLALFCATIPCQSKHAPTMQFRAAFGGTNPLTAYAKKSLPSLDPLLAELSAPCPSSAVTQGLCLRCLSWRSPHTYVFSCATHWGKISCALSSRVPLLGWELSGCETAESSQRFQRDSSGGGKR